MKNHVLRRDVEIHQIFTIFATITLNLLPFLASDYPEDDKSFYYKLFCKWNKNREQLVDSIVTGFCRGDEEINVSEFIKRSTLFP